MEGLQVVPVEILPGPEVPASGIQEAVNDRGFALERDHLVGGGVVGEGGKGHPGVVVQVVEEGLVSGGDPIPGAGVNAVTLHASSQQNSLKKKIVISINSLLPMGRYINMDPSPSGLLISWT